MNSVNQLSSDASIVKLVRRNDSGPLNDLLKLLPSAPPIYKTANSTVPDYYYKCTYSGLPIDKAFCFPLELFQPVKRQSPVLCGRFKDYACMWAWAQDQRQRGRIPEDVWLRMKAWFFKHYDNERLNIGPRVAAPPTTLLYANGGSLSAEEWERLYRKPDNFYLYRSLQHPHIHAADEQLLRETEQQDSHSAKMAAVSSSSSASLVAAADKLIDESLQQIDILTSTLPSSDAQPADLITKPAKRKTPMTDVEMKPANPIAKKRPAADFAPPSFSDFANSINHVSGSSQPSASAVPPKQPAKPRTKKAAAPASASSSSADLDKLMAAVLSMQKAMNGEKQSKRPASSSSAPASASSSSSSAAAAAAAANPLATLPSKKRVIHSQVGKQKKDVESNDFYHDLSKAFLSEPGFDLQAGGVRRAGLWLVDKNGQLSIMTLSGQKKASVDLLDAKK